MRFVPLCVDGWLGQQDRFAVRRHVLVLQGVEVAPISRQVPPSAGAHQPNLTTAVPHDITSHHVNRDGQRLLLAHRKYLI